MEKFLVINTSFFGDTLLTDPLCQNIKKAYPDSKVIFIVNKPFYEAACYMDGVDQVLAYDKKGHHKGLWGMIRFYKENKDVLRNEISASFVIYGNERGIILSKIFGVKKVYADNASLFRIFLDNKKLHYGAWVKAQDKHSCLLSCHTGLPFLELPMRYSPPQNAFALAEELLMQKGISLKSNFVAICTTSKKVEKDMDIPTCVELMRGLKKSGKVPVLVGAGESALFYVNKLKENGMKEFVDLTNQTSIAVLGAVLQRASALVSVDTGTLHLGLAVKTPVVAVFYLHDMNHLNTWAPKSCYHHRLMAGDDFSAEKMLQYLKELESEGAGYV